MNQNRVVVTGYATVTPWAMSIDELFENMKLKKTAISEFELFNDLGFSNKSAGYIQNYQWLEIEKNVKKNISKQSQISEYTVNKALQKSNIDLQQFKSFKSGLFIGSNKCCVRFEDLELLSNSINKDGKVCLDTFLSSSKTSSQSLRVDDQTIHLANILDVTDFISTHSDACAAGTIAIGSAYRAIKNNEIDIAICGGIELMANELPYFMFQSLGALFDSKDTQVGDHSRPFMKDRNGFVISEGAAFLILESEAHAKNRQANLYGRILGFYNHCESQKITSSQKDGGKYLQCMINALKDANLSTSEVDHVNTHGTSTQVNDECEAKAMISLYDKFLEKMTFSANKSALGHSLAASGAIEAVISLESLNQQIALPTINYVSNNAIYPQLKFLENQSNQDMNIIMSNSFGFGGENSSLILGKY